MSETPDHKSRGHSPLGASGAERWMNCPGSIALLKELKIEEVSDEEGPAYRREGTAMHEAAEHCLTHGLDTWEIVGQTFNHTEIDAPMADAVQVYLDVTRGDMDRASWFQVEYPISSPVHPDFYGTADFTAIIAVSAKAKANLGDHPDDELLVRDLKGGEGIVVEPDENPQLSYYAFGVIDGIERSSAVTLRDDLRVRLSITQPRAYHHTGLTTRDWTTTVGEIKAWVKAELLPAMAATEVDGSLDAGEWCRFCPAKLVCPLLTSLFGAAAKHNPKEIVNYSDESIGRSYQYAQAVEFYVKALKEEAFNRLNRGRRMEGAAKLVPKKSNRVWKPEAKALALAKFGEKDVMTAPVMKTPSQLEALNPAAKEFVKEHAYMPQTGLTVARWADSRPEVIIRPAAAIFADAVDKLTKAE